MFEVKNLKNKKKGIYKSWWIFEIINKQAVVDKQYHTDG